MAEQTAENLAVEVQLALAHTPPEMRDALRIFFELDHRIGRIVASTSEPMLGQMRLSWWREMLAKPVAERPSGDAVLDGIGAHWAGREAELAQLVDAWEVMLVNDALEVVDALDYGRLKSSALLAALGRDDSDKACVAAAWAWLCGDFAAKVSAPEERDMLRQIGRERGKARGFLPRGASGLAVLGALGRRAIRHGGSLMHGRSAALVAIRAAIFGR